MRKKHKDEEEIIEGEEVRRVWDIRKIVVGFIVLIIVLILASYVLAPPRYAGEFDSQAPSVSEEPPPLPDAEDIDSVLNNAQEALSSITSENLTSSQAAIQKIITDLQGLQKSEGVSDLLCNLVCSEK